MKKTITLLLAAAAALTVEARHLSADEALARVVGAAAAPAGVQAAPAAAYELAYEAEADGQAMTYVFTRTGGAGYLVVSADDAAPALLGYSATAAFDAAQMPDNLRAWLDGYARQAAWIASHPGEAAYAAADSRAGERADVAPLTRTLWDQGDPYNEQCPAGTGGKLCYTGCVATAMAQIMNYHQWPAAPTGSVSYTTSGRTYEMTYDGLTFEWDKMLNEYTADSPEEARTAVATLMKACGYAAQMSYSTSGSGAASFRAAAGMVSYFGYDRSLSLQRREWYGIEEWADLVYDELTTYGPVYYDGSGEGGGHAFVCDGYSSADGFFHFNWGWSGVSNGYYRLSLLSPTQQGIGGVSEGYNWDQAIMRGLKKAVDGSKPTYEFAARGGFKINVESVALGKNANFFGYDTTDGYINYSIFDTEGVSYGVRLDDAATGALSTYLTSTSAVGATFGAYTHTGNYICIMLPTDLAEGDYVVTPVYRVGDDGAWTAMRCNPAFRCSVRMSVANGTATFALTDTPAQIVVTPVEGPDYLTSNSPFTYSCKIQNVGTRDFLGSIRAVFWPVEEETISTKIQAEDIQIEVAAGATIDYDYTASIEKGSLTDGEYWLFFGNATTGEVISDFYRVACGNRYGELMLSYTGFNMVNSTYADCSNIQVTATINCPQGTYSGPIALLISKSKRNFNADYAILSADYELVAVESREVEIAGGFDGEVGATYYGVLAYRLADGTYQAMGDNYVAFTVGLKSDPESGIVDVASDATAAPVSVYNLQGQRVGRGANVDAASAGLAPGLYIIGNRKVQVR